MRDGRIKAVQACIDNDWSEGDILASEKWKAPKKIKRIQYKRGKAWVSLFVVGGTNPHEQVLTFPDDVRRVCEAAVE